MVWSSIFEYRETAIMMSFVSQAVTIMHAWNIFFNTWKCIRRFMKVFFFLKNHTIDHDHCVCVSFNEKKKKIMLTLIVRIPIFGFG